MGNFDKAIKIVLKHEGGFVNDPVDPGGATNYGVSLRWLRTQGLLGDFDGDGDVDADDIRAMTVEEAKAVYYVHWWIKYRYFTLLNDDLATKTFDLAVNMGAKQAAKLLQRAILQCGDCVVVDGVAGPDTLTKANRQEAGALVAALKYQALAFYESLITAKPEFVKYRAGWTRRAMA